MHTIDQMKTGRNTHKHQDRCCAGKREVVDFEIPIYSNRQKEHGLTAEHLKPGLVLHVPNHALFDSSRHALLVRNAIAEVTTWRKTSRSGCRRTAHNMQYDTPAADKPRRLVHW